jgi:hypothetical protein
LDELLKGENYRAEIVQSAARGKMTFGDAVARHQQRLENAQHLKPRTKEHRQSTIKGEPDTGTKNKGPFTHSPSICAASFPKRQSATHFF